MSYDTLYDWIPRFSILIPSWNNLEYLKTCIKSIRKNSIFPDHEILVFVNEGADGTLEWVRSNRLQYIHSLENVGIARAVNQLAAMSTSPFLVYFNDDMYALPGWDLELSNWIHSFDHDRFVLSATMIEPVDTGNSCVVVKDFGQDINNFNESQLLSEFRGLRRPHWQGAMWPPLLMPRTLWFEIGGFSVEFPGGFYTDPDLMAKAYYVGVRDFIGVGTSLVYHFMQKTTPKQKNYRKLIKKAKQLFKAKWNTKPSTFKKKTLRLGEPLLALPQKQILRIVTHNI
ncbi:MAG: glycosyltransferase family 2 protein [Chlorobi bacterium]|nr:glycosyltransferase family 2 protein [Chlorobiota bacterium]